MLYSISVPGKFRTSGADDAILAIHAVDFGLGFCSRLLPGAIYNLFFDSVGTVKTSIYLAVLLVLFFAALSFLLEKFILNVEPCHRKTALIILAFFLTGPSTFAIHVYYPGMFDMYWVFCALMFFVFLIKKQLRPLILLPFVLCITIYFASLICFIPFFVIILLYEISCSDTKKAKIQLWALLIVSTVSAIGLTLYLSACESDNLVYTIEEFHRIYSEKGVDSFFYFDQNLYKDIQSYGLDEFAVTTLKTDSPIERVIYEIALRMNYTFSKISLKEKLIVFALILPIVVFIFKFLFNQIRTNIKSRNRIKLFSNICMVALPFFSIFISVLFSEDLIRWTGHAFLTLFVSFIFILYREGEDAWKWLEERISKIPFTIILLYLTFYATTVYHPYYIG